MGTSAKSWALLRIRQPRLSNPTTPAPLGNGRGPLYVGYHRSPDLGCLWTPLSRFALLAGHFYAANNQVLIYGRKRQRRGLRNRQYRLEGKNRVQMSGANDGDFVRLRDEFGRVWMGQIDRLADDTFRLLLRDADGNHASGLADQCGVVLRDASGTTWRGIVE